MSFGLWVALFFPQFPLQVLARGLAEDQAVAVSDPTGPRTTVLARNHAARAAGVWSGMAATAAQALCRTLLILPRNTGAESTELANLAAWAGQFTPNVALSPPEGILLEIAGSLRLFGGVEALKCRIHQGGEAMGYEVALGTAATPLGAWWLAKAGREDLCPLDAPALRECLAPLPVTLLELPRESLERLEALGLRTLGDCLAQPRAGLVRRFGTICIDLLDRALGLQPDPRPWYVPPELFESRLELSLETGDTEGLLFPLRRLLVELEGFLRGQGAGVTAFDLLCHHRGQPSTRLSVGLLSVTRDSGRFFLLLRERLERAQLPAPVEALTLQADALLLYQPANLGLFPDPAEGREHWTVLLERLRARLGTEAVHVLSPVADRRPERAWRVAEGDSETTAVPLSQRPLWLLPAPRPLPASQDQPRLGGPLELLAGPERIEAGWWDGRPAGRDYFVARNARGESYWIFRQHGQTRRWFLHGVFA